MHRFIKNHRNNFTLYFVRMVNIQRNKWRGLKLYFLFLSILNPMREHL